MRIPDGLLAQYLIIFGWIFLIIWIVYLGRQNFLLTNRTYPRVASFTALQFILQIVLIPLFHFPIALGLSGIPFTVLTLGFRLGLFATTASLILSGFLIPGNFASLGVNVMNVVLASLIVLLPTRLFIRNRKNKTVRGVLIFFVTWLFIFVEGSIISLEMFLSNIFLNLTVTFTFLAVISVIGLIEGLLTSFLFRVIQEGDEISFDVSKAKKPLPRALREKTAFKLEYDPLGRYGRLDPRSKIIASSAILVGLALSFELYQELFYFFMIFPMALIYRPSKRFFKRLLMAIPVAILITILLYFAFQQDRHAQALKLGFRYFISIMHSSLLLESEDSYYKILEALRGLGIPKSIVNTILIALKMANLLWQDYNLLKQAAIERGAALNFGFQSNWFKVASLHFTLIGRLFEKGQSYSKAISDSLDERGFSGDFLINLSPITSEGITIASIVSAMSLLIMLSRFWM